MDFIIKNTLNKLLQIKIVVEANSPQPKPNQITILMSTISTVIADLPWLSQLVIYFLFVIVIAHLIILKFSLKAWHQLAPQLKKMAIGHLLLDSKCVGQNVDKQGIKGNTKQSKANLQNIAQQQKQKLYPLQVISIGLLKNYTFAQICYTNLSINKNYFLLLVQMWLYMLLCTQIFTPNYYQNAIESQNLYFNFLQIEHVKVFSYLGWLGILFISIDVVFRYYVTKNIVINTQNEQKMNCTMPIVPMNETIEQNKQQKVNQNYNINNQKIVYLYYFIWIFGSILLFVLALIKITSSKRNFNTHSVNIDKQSKNIFSVTDFYSSQQAKLKIAKSLTELLILMIINNILLLALSGLLYLISYFVDYSASLLNLWALVFGEHSNTINSNQNTKKKRNRNSNRKVAHSIQQSLGNLGHQTQRNKIQQQYIFQQNINKTIEQQSHSRKKDIGKYQPSRKISKTDSINTSNKKSLQPISVQTVLYNRYLINKQKFKQIKELDHNNSLDDSIECGQFSLRDIVKNQGVQNEKTNQNFKIQGDKADKLSEKFQTQRISHNKQQQESIVYKARTKQNRKSKKKAKIKAFFQETGPQLEQYSNTKMKSLQQANTSNITMPAHKNKNLKLISKASEQQFEQQHNFRVSQPILRNIENKLQQKSLRKKNFKKQLKIINFDQNHEGLDVIDLHQYELKDLGCVKAGTPSYVKPVLNFKNRFEDNQFMSSSIKNNNTLQSKKSVGTPSYKHSLHIHNSQKKVYQRRRPSVPEIKTNVTTFCMSDLSFDN